MSIGIVGIDRSGRLDQGKFPLLKMPMPPHRPSERSRAKVEALVGFGISHTQIADYLEITEKTLRKHYPRELATGVTKANEAVVGRLWKAAVEEGNVSALIFWTKARCGWRERQVHEIEASTAVSIQIVRPDELDPPNPTPRAIQDS